ncbi:MAG TPA: LuxR C-terminal-related transcriptional regulator [Bacilli bacterium]
MSHGHENLYLNNIERKIITLIIEGKNNKEIAGLIGLSVGTVKNYVSNLLQKYDFKNRMELAIYFIREEK